MLPPLSHRQEVDGPIAATLSLGRVTEISLYVLHVLQVCPGEAIEHLPLVGKVEVNEATLVLELAAVSGEVQTDFLPLVRLIHRFMQRIRKFL